ncbi:Hypothetical protein POVR1_LOCUS491 [uncultured virus]|nr:Hypothetical protein POVR1_LOCUS491 [uncultured virus]
MHFVFAFITLCLATQDPVLEQAVQSLNGFAMTVADSIQLKRSVLESQDGSAGNNPPYGVKRLISGGRRTTFPNGQPIPAVNILTLLDGDRTKMKRYPFYNDTYINTQKEGAFDFFLDLLGPDYDFRHGTLIPGFGAYSTPFGSMYPYATYPNGVGRLVYDSEYKNRPGEWVGGEAGWLMVSNSTGFYGGKRTGIVRLPGDIFQFTDWLFLEWGADWTNPRHREILKGTITHQTRQVPGDKGQLNTAALVDLEDERGNKGMYADNTFRVFGLDGNWSYVQSSVMIFF